ncbi:MAG: hypothetical protein ABL888_08300 [Pirellulaceae bacterium]
MIEKTNTVGRVDAYQRLGDPIPVPLLPNGSDGGSNPILFRPAVRTQRSLVVVATIAVTLGVLAIAFSSPRRNEFLSPGPLAKAHAHLMKEQGTERCAACHGAGSANLGQMIQDAFTGGQVFDVSQSHLCLACHSNSLNVDHAISPHGANPKDLNEMTNAKRMALAHANQVMPTSADNEIACAVCHREHQVKFVNLTAINDAKCQTCHAQAYDRFEGSHPDFQLANHPVVDRNIAFDHRSHSAKHFTEKGKAFECGSCHVINDSRGEIEVASFSTMCAECHQTSLQESLASGMSLIEMPTINVQALKEAGRLVPDWPKDLQGDFDGALSPLMTLLLMGDPAVRSTLAEPTGLFDFFEIDLNDEDSLRRSVELTGAITRLRDEITRNGRIALKKRIISATAIEISEVELDRLFWGLSDQQLQLIANQPKAPSNSMARFSGEKDFLVVPENLALSIQPDELLAVNPLNGKVGVQPPTTNQPNKEQHELLRSNSPRSAWSADKKQQGSEVKQAPPNPHGELLTPNPLSSAGRNLDQQSTASGLTDNLDGTHVHNVPPKRRRVSEPKYPPVVKPFAVDRFQLPSRRDGDSASVGQWSVNASPSEFLKYIPQGHADVVAQAWYELAHRSRTNTPQTVANHLLQKVVSAEGIGSCSRCHQAQRQDTAGDLHSEPTLSTFRWTYKPAVTFKSSFARFAHGPHLLLKDCTDCHQLNESSPNSHEPESVFESQVAMANRDFRPQTKLDCAACHKQGQAPNECSHCHRYHVGVPKNPLSSETPNPLGSKN